MSRLVALCRFSQAVLNGRFSVPSKTANRGNGKNPAAHCVSILRHPFVEPFAFLTAVLLRLAIGDRKLQNGRDDEKG